VLRARPNRYGPAVVRIPLTRRMLINNDSQLSRNSHRAADAFSFSSLNCVINPLYNCSCMFCVRIKVPCSRVNADCRDSEEF